MKIAILTSNRFHIGADTKKGTEIVFRMLVESLAKRTGNTELSITAFCSGDSDLPVRIESIEKYPTSHDLTIPQEKNIIFELALISKAFSMKDEFDIYHVHIGDGDIVLPFARFISRPVIITIHHTFDKAYVKRYFTLFKDLENVYFISLSNFQRKQLPFLPFAATIYNGIDTKQFAFDASGGDSIMWSGRGIPAKGLDVAFAVVQKTKKITNVFVIKKQEEADWLEKTLQLPASLQIEQYVSVKFDSLRGNLIRYYQKSKLFLFPIQWEEPFGLVLIESLSCGTPIVAYARGSVPEIVKDGETGFLVNPSDNDIRGNWIIKKTGVDGLCEAIEKIYSMPEKEYQEMRNNCRVLAEKSFSANKMAEEYLKAYNKIVKKTGE
ncbi:MAG: glycosyltransferase [Candidatus Daviesbacteria bacterium]|nr:glycosyltransferase [Candidatus Daviesbacteria bacterium]